MAAWLDGVKFTPTLGGTTDFVVSANVIGYMTPAQANAVNARVYKWHAESADLSQWEDFEGAYTVSGTVAARTTVLYNSSGTGTAQGGAGTKIAFSTVPTVSCVALKEDMLSIEEANSFTAAQQFQARNNIAAAALNSRLAKTANYSVVNTDKGQTIALGGSAFFTLTFSAASSFDANFSVTVLNEDAGRGKTLAVNGIASFILWPGQTATIYAQNNVWIVNAPKRWTPPSGTVNFYADFTNGNDANDGLAAGAGNAFQTVQRALYHVTNTLDVITIDEVSPIVINMAAGVTDTHGVHWAPHSNLLHGTAGVKILGGAGAIISTTGVEAIALFYGAVLRIQGVSLRTTTSGAGLAVTRGAKAYLNAVDWGACAGIQMQINTAGQVEFEGGCTISGNGTNFQNMGTGAIFQTNGAPLTFNANASYSGDFINYGQAAIGNWGSSTINLNAKTVTVTGLRYAVHQNAMAVGTGGGATYFPGANAGDSTGGLYQ